MLEISLCLFFNLQYIHSFIHSILQVHLILLYTFFFSILFVGVSFCNNYYLLYYFMFICIVVVAFVASIFNTQTIIQQKNYPQNFQRCGTLFIKVITTTTCNGRLAGQFVMNFTRFFLKINLKHKKYSKIFCFCMKTLRGDNLFCFHLGENLSS